MDCYNKIITITIKWYRNVFSVLLFKHLFVVFVFWRKKKYRGFLAKCAPLPNLWIGALLPVLNKIKSLATYFPTFSLERNYTLFHLSAFEW